MVFTKNNRHRKNGLNAFDKRISKSISSMIAVGFLICGMPGAYASPDVVEKEPTGVEVENYSDILIPEKTKLVEPLDLTTVKIPEISANKAPEMPNEILPIEIILEPDPAVVEELELVADEKADEETSHRASEVTVDELNDKEELSKDSVESNSSVTSFASPLTVMNVSSGFGYRVHPVYKTSKLHEGADFSASCGTPVYASANGKVVEAGNKSSRAGIVVEIDHGSVGADQINTNYYHLSEVLVSSGENVEQGDLIGKVGSTGASTGCHLHFGVTVNGQKTNPMSYLN